MSIGAQAGEPFEAIADGAALSLVGEITVEIYDPSTGAVIVAPSAAGITEPRPGTYRVELTCPSAGSYSIRWQSPSGEAAEENLLVTDTAVIVPHESLVPSVAEVAALLRARTKDINERRHSPGEAHDKLCPLQGFSLGAVSVFKMNGGVGGTGSV